MLAAILALLQQGHEAAAGEPPNTRKQRPKILLGLARQATLEAAPPLLPRVRRSPPRLRVPAAVAPE